jgi:hypothetical protein
MLSTVVPSGKDTGDWAWLRAGKASSMQKTTSMVLCFMSKVYGTTLLLARRLYDTRELKHDLTLSEYVIIFTVTPAVRSFF